MQIGDPVFQFSRIAARALSEQRQCQVKIDFLPFFQQGDMEKIKESISKVAYKILEEFLSGMAHKKIASLIGNRFYKTGCQSRGITCKESNVLRGSVKEIYGNG